MYKYILFLYFTFIIFLIDKIIFNILYYIYLILLFIYIYLYLFFSCIL